MRILGKEDKHVGLPKSSQVSPNARRRAQCKGGGGKKKNYMYSTPKKCQTLYNLQASLRERRRNNYIEQKSRKHGKRESHRAAFLAIISQLPKALYLQNISNFVSPVCCGRPRGGYVGRGCHASVLLKSHLFVDKVKGHGWGKATFHNTGRVRLHVVCSRCQTGNSRYWLSFTICESSLLCQQVDFSEQKCFHQKQTKIFRCHRDTNRLFWSWAPVHP